MNAPRMGIGVFALERVTLPCHLAKPMGNPQT